MHKKLELADILALGMEKCCDSLQRLSSQQLKVVRRLLCCHSPQLGGHVYRCDNCAHTYVTYNSCRDRHCPSCQSVARAAWVEQRLGELLPVGYFHVVFTIPQELNRFALNNKKSFYDMMFESISETLLTLGKDPRWHGGTIGFIAVLHTWGQNLSEHPHIHCIIPGGGIRDDGKRWKNFRDNYIFPVKVMSLLFRRVFLEKFTHGVCAGAIRLHGSLDHYRTASQFESLVDALRKKQWVVYAKEPFASPAQVVKYVGSYTHRIAIANSRLVSADSEHVCFRWKDYREPEKQKVMKLGLGEFIRRFLLHVLPARFVRIRYYGFLSNHNRQKNIARCMRLLNRKYRPCTIGRTQSAILARTLHTSVFQCRLCKKGQYRVWDKLEREPINRRMQYNTHRGPP